MPCNGLSGIDGDGGIILRSNDIKRTIGLGFAIVRIITHHILPRDKKGGAQGIVAFECKYFRVVFMCLLIIGCNGARRLNMQPEI